MNKPDPLDIDALAQIIDSVSVDPITGGARALAEATLAELEKGRDVARAYAHWHIGDRRWADSILSAYHHPHEVLANLNARRAQYPDVGPIEFTWQEN